MAKHTPGPWFVGKIRQEDLVQVKVKDGREEYSICDLWCDVWEDIDGRPLTREQKANACLIAAAPDLLEALEGLWPFIHERGMAKGEKSPFKAAWLKAEAAMRKAKVG